MMALKDWLDTGKCLLGFHEGEFRRENEASCVLLQTCNRCGVVSQRLDHSWSDWTYLGDHRCDLSRTCTRCSERETRIEHHWSDWMFRREGLCEQSLRCQRCGEWGEDSRTQHDWQAWYYSERYRAPIHQCGRCNLIQSYFPAQQIDQRADGGKLEEDLTAKDRSLGQVSTQTEHTRPHEREGQESVGIEDLASLRRFYQEQVAAGVIAPERRPLLSSILSELEEIIATEGATLADTQIKARRVQNLFAQLSEGLINPSRPQPVNRQDAAPRVRRITDLHNDLYRYMITETANVLFPREEGKAAAQLMGRLTESREALAALPGDDALVKIEHEFLRPLALEIRNFSLRHHLMLAQPIWPSRTVAQQPSEVFYSGDAKIDSLLARVYEARALRRPAPETHQEPSSFRWQQLRAAAVAVFDFTSYERSADFTAASLVAPVAYELGIALALGRPVVIGALEHQDLPFDLDIEPVRLLGDNADDERVSCALDNAFYALQRGSGGSSVEASIKFLRNRFGGHSDLHVRGAMASLDNEASADPVRAKLLIQSALEFLGAEANQLITPAWPGSYPDPKHRRCFHVTAFGPPWSAAMMRLVQDSCGSDTEYVRGDRVLAPDILRSIWDEICRATHIVVDLTGLNANVALELGIAHALGRNVLLVSQDENPARYFRAIAKQRIHRYDLSKNSGDTAVQTHLKRFLG